MIQKEESEKAIRASWAWVNTHCSKLTSMSHLVTTVKCHIINEPGSKLLLTVGREISLPPDMKLNECGNRT